MVRRFNVRSESSNRTERIHVHSGVIIRILDYARLQVQTLHEDNHVHTLHDSVLLGMADRYGHVRNGIKLA